MSTWQKKKKDTSRTRKRTYRLLGLTVDVASKPRISLSLSLFLSENWYYYSIKSISKRSSLKLKENFLLIDFDFSLFCSVSVTRMIWSDGEESSGRRKKRCWRIRWPLCCRSTSGTTWGDSTKRLWKSVFGKVCSFLILL